MLYSLADFLADDSLARFALGSLDSLAGFTRILLLDSLLARWILSLDSLADSLARFALSSLGSLADSLAGFSRWVLSPILLLDSLAGFSC